MKVRQMRWVQGVSVREWIAPEQLRDPVVIEICRRECVTIGQSSKPDQGTYAGISVMGEKDVYISEAKDEEWAT